MIEVEHLSKTYGSTAAIADVSFSVETGEILGFLGPNGAGKTTTMRILSGYLPASSGTARIAGLDVHEKSMAVRQRIGYLPENPPLYPEMTVEGFLFFVARIKQVPAGDLARRVTSAIERCGLVEKRKVLIRKLSKGFKQRVGIAQAIVHDPPVIILDEPTVGLDPRQIIEVRNLIKSLAGQHTIILSTHILPEVSMTCSRVTIINRGQIVASGTPERLMGEFAAGSGYELEVEGETELVNNLLLPSLANLPGVRSLELIQDREFVAGRYGLRAVCESDLEPGREIAAAIVASGFGLCEMRRTRASLEDVFLRMTTAEKKPGDVLIQSEPEVDRNLQGTEIQDAIAPSHTELEEPIVENLPVTERQESPYDSPLESQSTVETVESIEHSPPEPLVETAESIEHSPLESQPLVETAESSELVQPEPESIAERFEPIEYSAIDSQPIVETAESSELVQPEPESIAERFEPIEYSAIDSQPIVETAESSEHSPLESQPIVENLQSPEKPEFSGEVQPEMQPVADFLQVVAMAESIEPSEPPPEPIVKMAESIEPSEPEPEPIVEISESIELSQSEPIVTKSELIEHPEPEPIVEMAESIESSPPETIVEKLPVAETKESIEHPEPEPVVEMVESIESSPPEPIVEKLPVAETKESIETSPPTPEPIVERQKSIEPSTPEPIVERQKSIESYQSEPEPMVEMAESIEPSPPEAIVEKLPVAETKESIETSPPTPEPIVERQKSIESYQSELQPVVKNRQIEKKQQPTSDSQPEETQPVVKNRQMKKKQPPNSDTQLVAKNRQTEKKQQPSSDSETTPIPDNPE